MNLHMIPVVGWILGGLFSVSMSVPFWFCWTICGIGRAYFDFLPSKYQSIPFWHCVGLAIVIGILKTVLIPRLVNVDHKCEQAESKP